MIYDLIVLGGGPAGYLACERAGHGGLKTLLIESKQLGGKATTAHWIENFPGFPEVISGPDLVQRMRDQSVKCGATIKTETVDKVFHQA